MSVWGKFLEAAKAGAKGAADSFLAPKETASSAPAVAQAIAPAYTQAAASGGLVSDSVKKWAVPAIAAGLVGYTLLRPSGRR